MKTIFNVAFIDNFYNTSSCNIIAFNDLSTYNNDLVTDSPLLTILYPDFKIPVVLSYTPSTINTIQVPTGDGLYTIELSICPNNTLKQTFYYFQICQTMNALKTIICKNTGDKDKVLKFMDIFKYLTAIQMIASTDPLKANIMFAYVKTQIC